MTYPALPSNGRVALITGGGAGLGRATAERLAREGLAVAVLDRHADKAVAVAAKIEADGGLAMALSADLTDLASMERALAVLAERWGRLDVLVANAGVNGVWAGLDELTEAEFTSTLDINLTGTFRTFKVAVPLMRQSGDGGSIVVVASVNGTRMFSNSGATAYAASKAGQVAMARLLAVELARHGIRVNTVCPGAFQSELEVETVRRDLSKLRRPVLFPEGAIPLSGKAGASAERVAESVWFLASEASAHTTGTELYVDGGQSLLQG